MNLNKLFPRLSIRAKLGIAFTVLALLPLGVVAIVTTRVTVARLRAAAAATLDHDVETARRQVERALGRAEQDVVFLSDALLRPPLLAQAVPSAAVAGAVREFLDHGAYLFRVKAVTTDGLIRFQMGSGTEPRDEGWDEAGGTYYAYRAAALRPAEHLLLPVEVRATDPGGTPRPVPAVAILVPVRDSAGRFAGVIVGEAYAATLFAGLADASPGVAGTTGLVDADGRFLYHSERKRDWRSLFAVGVDPDLQVLFRQDQALVPARRTRHLVRRASLALGAATGGPLTLVRAVPAAELDRPVREFLLGVTITGALAATLVIGLAVLAARQLSRPIYALRGTAHALARGDSPPPIRVETNDEIEDLATDFGIMAEELARQRRTLQELVAERTQQLRRTHAELSDVLAHSADAIVGLDTDGRIRVWNRGAEQLFGHSPAEALGRGADELLAPPGAHRGAEQGFIARELADRGAVVDFPTERVARDGRRIPVRLTLTRLQDDEGRALGASLILRDATAQATLEAHMRRSERLATISVLAAGLAHELNNPLAIIDNRLECMEGEITDLGKPSLARDLSVLREHTTRLGQLTRNLLRFARDDDAGRGPVRLDATARRVRDLLERSLAGRNVQIALDAEDAPAVTGSPSALETVCLNLILNAADAMPDGGCITVRIGPQPGGAEMMVSDEGEGVPVDLRERIFEPFFTTKSDRGTGLGLSVCRTIVERHGGTIRAEPGASRGSRFVVRLPAASDART